MDTHTYIYIYYNDNITKDDVYDAGYLNNNGVFFKENPHDFPHDQSHGSQERQL